MDKSEHSVDLCMDLEQFRTQWKKMQKQQADSGQQQQQDEDDYMSSVFAQDTEPSPPSRYIAKRKREEAVKKQPQKSLREIERDKLKEGLATSIPQDSKGFKMLKLMGYKEGTGLGKAEEGITEPIAIHLNQNRSGLGLLEQRQRSAERHVKKKEALVDDFRGRMKGKFQQKKALSQYVQAFALCVQLDQEKQIEESPYLKRHLEEETKKQNEEEEEEEGPEHRHQPSELPTGDELEEELAGILSYLRERHLYCFFCGCGYSDAEDMHQHCPGPTEEAHE